MIRHGTAAAVAMLFSTATLGAQATEACSFNSDGSAAVNTASAAIGAFNATTDRAEQVDHVKTAVAALTAENVRADSTLKDYMLGQALIAYSMIPDAPLVTTRGEVGFATDPSGPVNILAATDSVFDRVIAAKPCAEAQVVSMRTNVLYKAMNVAVTEFNAGNYDVARSLGEAAIAVDDELAPAYHLVGNVDVTQNNYAGAFENFEKAAEYAAKDSAYADIRSSVLLSLGVLAQNQAEELQGAEQQAMAARSAAYFREHLENEPDDAAARSGLARVLQLSGDTAAVASLYAEMITNAESYDYAQLLEAGVNAINDGRDAEAAQMLEVAHRKSPHSRDILFALTVAYTGSENYEELIPVAKQLIEVDPSNPDNYQLLSQGYQGMVELGDRNARRAYGDSLIRTQREAASLTERVTFRGIGSDGTTRMLEGDIENLGEEPRTFVINFELLSEDGRVVATEQVTVADVEASGSSSFTVPMRDPAAVHYRYARIGGQAGTGN